MKKGKNKTFVTKRKVKKVKKMVKQNNNFKKMVVTQMYTTKVDE